MALADRIRLTLKAAGLNPRSLAKVANVHYTTIYLTLKKGKAAKPLPTVSESLNKALDTIDKLIEYEQLPFTEKLSQEGKEKALLVLFSKYH